MPPTLRERGRFASLFVSLLFFIGISPWIADHGGGNIVLQVAVWAIFMAGVYAASARRSQLKFALLLLLPAFIAWAGPDIMAPETDETLRMLSASFCFVFSAYVVARASMSHDEVTLDTILGGINAYLLIAFAFVFVYATLMIQDGGALVIGGRPLAQVLTDDADKHGFATLLYFSFTTLTTLGYGDIAPASGVARLVTSTEAVIGQLYVAILIGRLVGLEVANHRRSD
jgi:hypothetical protein